MPRHPRPLDPESGPLAVFALELRALRDRMGPTAPTVDQISEKQQIPRSTLYAAMSGTRIPTVDVLAALVRAWDGDLAVWTMKRAAVVQAVGLQRLQDGKVNTIRVTTPPPQLSQDAINYLERQARADRTEQYRRLASSLAAEWASEIRRMREQAGLSSHGIIKRVEEQGGRLARSTFSEIQQGRRLARWETIEQILRALLPESEFQPVADKWKREWDIAHAAMRAPGT